ncbi:MAG: outer membrane lipoprotein-sorting protein [Acidiferrobacterales bacterium]
MRALLALLLIALPLSVGADAAEKKGLAIAVEADRRDTGWDDQKADMTMILRNKHGQQSRRQVRTRAKEVTNDGDKSFVIFDQPRDVKGTALLSFSHKIANDDQWLYLPALKRVKRIASANKSGSFVGSEFAYEDVSSQEVEKYTYKHLRDEVLADQDSFVIERYPVSKYSGYTRQVVWIDKAEYRPLKVDYYDRKNSLLKTLTFSEYNEYLGKYWRAHKMHMVNHQTGKSTLLEWSNYKLRNGFTDRDFDKTSLKRVR